jgi:hypothetical protein
MDAKRIFIVSVIALIVNLEPLRAAMPFGRLMPVDYSPDDVRTITVSKSQRVNVQISSFNPFSEDYQIKRDPIIEKSRDYIVPAIDAHIDQFSKPRDWFLQSRFEGFPSLIA